VADDPSGEDVSPLLTLEHSIIENSRENPTTSDGSNKQNPLSPLLGTIPMFAIDR